MSDTAAEIDEVILRIILGSEYGPQWLADVAHGSELDRRLLALRQRGLCDRLAGQLRECGSLELVAEVEAMPWGAMAGLNSIANAEQPPQSDGFDEAWR